MSVRRIIFTAEKESFIVRVLMKKIQDTGLDCVFVPYKIDNIFDAWDSEEQLIALYMEDDVRPREDVLHFITDKMEEQGGQLILIGAKEDLKIVNEHIPKGLICRAFPRPVDNEEFVNTVTRYYDKVDSGELKKSILIVDDDPQYLGLVRQWLSQDYKVSLASSGLQAIKFLGKNKVDLILLDHEMPVTTGPQVLEMLRSDVETKSIPVMFLTGKSDKDSVMAVVALHPEGYFLKSISREKLLKELKEFFILHPNL
ncbi:MAG: response regulator [Lachnospiraceae bacterium]|nr:response regulator [Lachnospiraceae bacterium]